VERRKNMSITYKGIMEQIRENPAKEPCTLEEFRVELNKGLWEQLDNNNKREFVIQTGSLGYQMFMDQFKRSALLESLKNMEEYFTLEEITSLTKMIDSPDIENMEVASVIMELKSTQKPTQDVSNIQTKGS
jgi:hypothetical protein